LERRAHRFRLLEQTEAAVLAIHALHTNGDELITLLLTHLSAMLGHAGVSIWTVGHGEAQPVRVLNWPDGLMPAGSAEFTVLRSPLAYDRFGQDAFLAAALPAAKTKSPALQRALDSLTKHAAIALEHLDLDADCLSRAAKLEMLNAIGQKFTANLSPQDLYVAIYAEVRKVMIADVFFVALYDDINQEVDLAYIFENGHQLPPLKFPLNDGPTSRVISTNSPLLFNTETFPASSLTRFGNKTKHAQSLMMVPISSKDKVLGALSVQSFTPNAHNEDDLNVLSTIASQAAIAIENANLYEKTCRLAETDGLTGLMNRRTFVETLDREISLAQELSRPLSVVMIDSDSLKQINTQYGYHAGDEHLCNLARIIKSCVRLEDTVARYGGDEFTLLLPDTETAGATAIAKRIIERVNLSVHTIDGVALHVTVSGGVAEFPHHGTNRSELLLAVDRATHSAKRAGKNRLFVVGHESN